MKTNNFSKRIDTISTAIVLLPHFLIIIYHIIHIYIRINHLSLNAKE